MLAGGAKRLVVRHAELQQPCQCEPMQENAPADSRQLSRAAMPLYCITYLHKRCAIRLAAWESSDTQQEASTS